jgi:hypothetical protein
MTNAYPLNWPEGWPRTAHPSRSKFATDFVKARDHLANQLKLMGARYVVISSNLQTRQDGLPIAKQAEPRDGGVAVYFERKGKQMVFACDKWDRARDNIRAIGMTIEAIRGMERWGASEMMERTFAAVEALEAPKPKTWWTIMECPRETPVEALKIIYRNRVKQYHPDAGGTAEQFQAIHEAYQDALREKGAS